MTNGDPLYARAAMKPLPTLTKPLRSVDIATKQPAQALRERTDSCTVPAAGVVGEAMVAFVLADAYRAKFGGDHIDDVIAAVDAYRERIGWRRPPRRRSHGARLRRVHGRREVLGARRRARHRHARRGPARDEHRVLLRRLRRGRFRSARSRSCCARCARARRRSRSAAAACSPRRSATALREHTVVWMDISDETAWARAAGDDRPLAADRAAFEALHAERRPLYESIADAFLPEGDRLVRRAKPALDALAHAPAGTKLVWAVAGGREYPVFVGRGLIGGLPRPGRRAFVVTDANVGAAYGGALRDTHRTITIAAGRGAQDARRRRDGLARARRAGDGPRRPPRRARRRRRRRPRRLLRGHLPARRPGRSGADDGGRTGRLGLWRQDRRRPARGEELRRRLPPAGGRHHRRRHARTLPPKSSPRATPRSSRRR